MHLKHLPTRRVLLFKKWSRKTFAVYNTLHKEIKIGVLSVSAFATLGAQQTAAQTDTIRTNDKVDLEEVVVSADATPELQSEVARVVTVITKDEIQASPVNSIADLLEFALNVDVRQRGVNGVQSDISIRGGSYDQVMVLLNGVNISDPQTGHNMMNLPVDLSQVDRIEVLQGAGARHLGANAFSGAINIITGSSENNKIQLSGSAGEYGFYDGNLSIAFHNSLTHHQISAGLTGSSGYIENTDFKRQNIYYNGGLDLDFGSFVWQAGYTDNGFGANSFYTPVYPDQYEAVKTNIASLGFTTGTRFKVSPTVYVRNSRDRFELFRDKPATYPYNFHKSNVYGSRINTTYYWALGKTSLGAEIRNENSLSNTLGNIPDTVKVNGYDAFYYKSYTRTNYSAYAEHQFSSGPLFMTAAVMAFGSTSLNSGISFYPGLDISYELLDGFRVKGSVNRSLRMPTFTDLFYNGPTNVGNPDLKPETAWSYEGGFKFHKKGIASHITAFYRQGTNLIDWVQLPDNEKYTTTNYTQLNTFGIETSTRLDITKMRDAACFIRRVGVSYSYLNSDKVEQDYDSRYALDYLKHKFTVTLNHSVVSKIFAEWNASWQDRAGTYQKYLGRDPETSDLLYQTTPYAPFWMVSGKVYWENDRLKLFAEASNIFDVKYMDVANVVQPGRWVKAGVVFRINY
ncbi:TonB-dependent receptor plug domain-containing protein [Saccharicrinis sp. FJH54]|uniref:TonB-dependent receptor plug domain-containing protein n=1 Tax=Saccharicrinis sp. FJH54 TaxID=3344665 RepID=UPI0035D4ABA6